MVRQSLNSGVYIVKFARSSIPHQLLGGLPSSKNCIFVVVAVAVEGIASRQGSRERFQTQQVTKLNNYIALFLLADQYICSRGVWGCNPQKLQEFCNLKA